MTGWPNIRIRLVFNEEKRPYLLDISSLLYDFELLHDFSLLLCAEDYSDYRFSRFFWYRKGRPLKANHKLRATRIIKESPLTVELIVSGVILLSGAFWALVQAIEKISNWKLDKEKKRLEIEKLKRELSKANLDIEKARIELDQKVLERETFSILRSLIRRLESNPISLVDIEFYAETDDEKGGIL